MRVCSKALRLLLLALIGLGASGYAATWAQQPAPPTKQVTPPAQQQPAVPATPQPAAPAQPPATAQPAAPEPPRPAPLPPEMIEPIKKLSKSIDEAEKSIQQLKEIEGELSRVRTDVERIIYDSTARAEELRPQLEDIMSQLQKLGPAPAKDQPPEPSVVAAERKRLEEHRAALEGAIRATELAWVRAKKLIDRITVIRYQQFTRNLLERRESPLLPSVWRDVGSRTDTVVGRLKYYGGDWLDWALRKSRELVALSLGALAVFGLGTVFANRLIAGRLPQSTPSPSFFDRIMKAAWVAPVRMLPLLAATAILYFGLDALDLLFAPWDRPALAIAQGLAIFAVAYGLLATAFAPNNPQWRIFPVADGTARRLLWIMLAFVAVFGIDTVMIEMGRALYVPLTFNVVQSFLTSLLFAGLLAALLLTRFEHLVGPDRPVNGHEFIPPPVTRHTPLWIKLPLWLVALIILASSVLGYVALGRFIAHQFVLSGIVLLTGGILYLAIRAATRGRAGGQDIIGNALERQFGFEGSRRRQVSRFIELILTLVVGLVVLPALLLQWGMSGADIRDWLNALLFGFEIGTFRISLVRILLGIALFAGLLFVTRMVQRWLRERVLSENRIDAGIANSIETAIGYAGTALALLLAVSYAGFDVTSLAIVASALAVGIGFGLQSIVNNFVSGLILLVERPIKVGDWIVVGTEQGNVRRISVRSTEIETFDRASLIVPNSELVTGRVLNWTHRNLLGRTMVKITASPDADPEIVLNILRECAEAHPDVLKQPAPFVSFDNFSGNGLDFTVRMTLADVTKGGSVSNDIRIAALKAMREAGIASPNPQFDIHLRDLDYVKQIARRIAEQRSNEQTSGTTQEAPPAPGTRT